jgi:hypothetical protein
MATYNFQAGDNQNQGSDFREKLRLDLKAYAQQVCLNNHQEVYNIPKDRATLVIDYQQGFEGSPGEETSVLLTIGQIVSPNPKGVVSKLEKLTKIKLIKIKNVR